jgi:predicted nucleic acid-binding protein
MKPSVYVETTIPSFYHEVRTDADMVARRDWTREWWDDHRQKYDVFTSMAVLDELERGNFDKREDAISFLDPIPFLEITESIADTVAYYINNQVMPADPGGDALHLAIASAYECDFILTWNCRHLANANKFARIRQVNATLGLFVPSLVTPLELLGDTNDEN